MILDALGAGVLLGMGAIAGDKSVAAKDSGMPDSTADTLAIVGLAGGLVLAISAAVGEHTYKECDRAMETWRLGAAIGGGNDERAHREARDFEKRHRSELAAAEKSAATNQPVEVPRGFFCATSATHVDAGFCVREKADCQRSRA